MTSVKPYFIKALHEWIIDNGLTPLAVVDASYPGVRVPDGVVEDGKVVLNVSYDATQNLQMDDEILSLNARFAGVSHAVIVPMESISAIYARENGKGMMFDIEDEDFPDDPETDSNEQDKPAKKVKPHLKLVD
ncbi:MAG: ClpXP protease specificity-enhancing factor [Xanthomonadales bacterium]|nr:ClpXP protease specificity-enhancing factor [Xanthomonadales bacterium]